MKMICLDVEGVLLPEIWQHISNLTGIKEFNLTTREEPDYDKLMSYRISLLQDNKLKLNDLLDLVNGIEPLSGAVDFLSDLREKYQVSLISDSYYEFLQPLSKKLNYPTIYCHNLIAGNDGQIIGWKPRLVDQKPKCVSAFQNLGFEVLAAGDSFNDIGMLKQANYGAFIHAPSHIVELHPEIPSFENYPSLKAFTVQNFSATNSTHGH